MKLESLWYVAVTLHDASAALRDTQTRRQLQSDKQWSLRPRDIGAIFITAELAMQMYRHYLTGYDGSMAHISSGICFNITSLSVTVQCLLKDSRCVKNPSTGRHGIKRQCKKLYNKE